MTNPPTSYTTSWDTTRSVGSGCAAAAPPSCSRRSRSRSARVYLTPSGRRANTPARMLRPKPEDIARNAVGDPNCGLPHRLAREMRVARRRFLLAVTEKATDHRQHFAWRQPPRCERVPAVVQAHVLVARDRGMRFHMPEPTAVRCLECSEPICQCRTTCTLATQPLRATAMGAWSSVTWASTRSRLPTENSRK